MRKRLMLVAIAVAAIGALVGAQGQSDRARVRFEAAKKLESVDGDLKGAIEQYKTLAGNSDRAVAAKALVRMAASYDKLGLDDARNAYERVVREFADETASAAAARTRLAAMQTASGAGVGQTTRLLWSDRRLSTSEWGPISADGRYLTFSYLGLTIVDLKAGTTKTFSPASLGDDRGYVEGSAISPDGRQVAYVLALREQEEVRVLQVNGGDAAKSRRVLTNPGVGRLYLFGWSPDGKRVVVTRAGPENQTNEIAVVSIADGAVRVLQTNKGRCCGLGARFSPDGGRVVYSRSDSGNAGGLFVATMDGKETHIEVGPGQNREPIWSHDGSHILFESNRTGTWSLWMAPVTGGRPSGPARLIKENVGPFYPLGFTRSGTLYYLGGSRTTNVYTAELDAKLNAAAPSMATNQYINSNRAGVWSPDGQNLAYQSVTPRGVFIRVRSVKTGEDREVPSPIRINGPVRWFPDGQSLLVASRDARVLNGELGYYRVSIASGDAQLLHQTASRDVVSTRPDLSLDGRTIFYLGTPAQPVRFDIDSRRATGLTPVGNRTVALAVSPDGTQVAYLAYGSVSVAPATGGEPRAVARFSGPWTATERDDGLGLAWSPDQRYLFFVKPEGGTGDGSKAVWRVPLTGGEAENVGISMDRIRSLRVHPDGRRITFDSVLDPRSEVWALENFLPKATASK